jgi:hypothetical protein
MRVLLLLLVAVCAASAYRRPDQSVLDRSSPFDAGLADYSQEALADHVDFLPGVGKTRGFQIFSG